MKILLSYMICTMLAIINSFGQTQNNVSKKQAENMLFEFYTKHFYIWENTPISASMPANILHGKLDSLMQRYCTLKVRHEEIRTFENVGADWITKDLIGDLNENLRVKKDSTKENWYVVSFISTNIDTKGKPVRQKVILYVKLVKEGKGYKIDFIK